MVVLVIVMVVVDLIYGDHTPDPSVQTIKFVWNTQAQAGDESV